MLPKKRRIARKDFSYIISNGTKYNSPILMLNLAKMKDIKEDSKFSFSVSKKVAKSAVDRNKLRRRGYSVIEKNINNIKPNSFLFFVYKKGSGKSKYSLIESDIAELLSKSFMLE